MRQSFLRGGMSRMKIVIRFDWDDEGQPTMVLHRNGNDAAIGLNDAHRFADGQTANEYSAKIASALGLDYWSSIDRNAVLDAIYRNIDDLITMPPAPLDGLDEKRRMMQDGVTRVSVRADGKTVMEKGL